MKKPLDKKTEICLLAEKDLAIFIQLVHPLRVLGSIHLEICRWWEREGHLSHQLTLLPRDHQKSALIGYWTAWQIVKDPTVRVLYISSTANLAHKQLKFIKDILTSDQVRKYWPELINVEEGKREKWTENEISVDHPSRKRESVRDPTVFTAGLTTGITGMHCDITVMDDVVVKENAYTEEGRKKVQEQYSLLSSIETGNARQMVVGTRYHPKDLYNDMMSMKVDIFNDDGEEINSYNLYEKFEKVVEVNGEFLWPRQQRPDGKWFGFDKEILAKKKAQYLDKVQFQAQYYNNPNDPDGGGIKVEAFQYYDRKFLTRNNGHWFFQNKRLNVFAAIDFAFSLNKAADYTSIVVVGIDGDRQYYILDIDRFKTDLMSEYFDHILRLHQKWDFRKLKAEVTQAQQVIVSDLKQTYIRQHGLALAIEDFRPNRTMGNKQERVSAILQPRYANRQVWHYMGGHCQTLEEELVLSNPPHDDIKDCLASCIDSAIAPSFQRKTPTMDRTSFVHSRFGGMT